MQSVVLLILLALLMLIGFVLLKEPRTDRTWLPEQAIAATAEIENDIVTIRGVRDWTYDEEAPLTTDWNDVSVDPSTIVRTWFLVEPFSDIEAVGHTFLSFELENGTVLSFSVEARREATEEYSAIKGQFREYELAYQWGTERDFVTRRLINLDHPLRLYPLTLTPEQSQALFRSLAEETQTLSEEPRFYNTLTANCTNVLAKIVNRHYPGTLPYDIAWNLTGYADLYLMEQGLIETTTSKEEAIAAHDLTPFRTEIMKSATTSPTDFSKSIRSLISY
ncbi:MAG: hypothetical protein QG636_255 [Patescibacteria group bacterium]|jgi:hypothetical protein|nr:hypothetical protein [Patescibacteria group bacterium]